MAIEPRKPGDPQQYRFAHIVHALIWAAAMLSIAAVVDREVGQQILPWMIAGWFASSGLLASSTGARGRECERRLFR